MNCTAQKLFRSTSSPLHKPYQQVEIHLHDWFTSFALKERIRVSILSSFPFMIFMLFWFFICVHDEYMLLNFALYVHWIWLKSTWNKWTNGERKDKNLPNDRILLCRMIAGLYTECRLTDRSSCIEIWTE
jgi:hypothetical protein